MNQILGVSKVIVTGGAGFIGSHLVDRLLATGICVLIIDNYQTGLKENNQPHDLLTIVEADISDFDIVETIFKEFKPDLIIHAAASYRNPEDWLGDLTTNIVGTLNVIKAAKQNLTKRIIYLQTSLCYGIEPSKEPLSPSHAYFSGTYRGGSSYAISKTAAELYLELSGISFISFRLANIFGPRNLSGPLPNFFKKAMSGEKILITNTRRDFLYVDDLVDCIFKAISRTKVNGYFNLGTGKDFSIKELFTEFFEQMDSKTEIFFEFICKGEDDVDTILLDISNTEKVFEWSPTTSFKTGIKQSLDYYRKCGIKNTFTHLKHISK